MSTSTGTARLDTLRNVWTFTTADGRTYTAHRVGNYWVAVRLGVEVGRHPAASILRDRILGGWLR